MRTAERFTPTGESQVMLDLRVDEKITLTIDREQHHELLARKRFSDYPYSLCAKSHISYTVTLLEVA